MSSLVEISVVVVKPGLVVPQILLAILLPDLVVGSGLSKLPLAPAWLSTVLVLFGE
jgi:hypothetical protein